MRYTNKVGLIATGIAAGLLYIVARHKAKRVEGIGAIRKAPRRIWSEIEQAQRAGIDLTDPDGWKIHKDQLRRMASGKLSESVSDKPDEQRYFMQLRRAYKSIAGTTLPRTQSVVRNEFGDVILIYNDYHLERLPQDAAAYISSQAEDNMGQDPVVSAWWATVAGIANGTLKFVWNSAGVHRGVNELLFGNTPHPEERKARISYLASVEKGGIYPEQLAHRIWQSDYSDRSDDQEILNGILDALREVTSVGQAQKICIDRYLQDHQADEPTIFDDLPF